METSLLYHYFFKLRYIYREQADLTVLLYLALLVEEGSFLPF